MRGLNLHALRVCLGRNRLLVVFGVLYLGSQAIILTLLRDLGLMQFARAQTTFSKATFLTLVHQWESAQLLPQYQRHFYFDFVHPVWYSCLLAGFIAKGLDRRGISDRWNWLLLMPFLAGLMDLVENCFHVRFIADLAAVTQPMITLSALAANLKWTLAGLSLVVIAHLWTAPPNARN
jgi:hypothetical protein